MAALPLLKILETDTAAPFQELCDRLDIGNGPGWPDDFGLGIQAYFRKERTRPIRTLSLFSGAGGLDVGFHDAGFEILEMVEVEPRYAASLEANAVPGGYLGSGVVNTVDIRLFDPKSSKAIRSGVDLIIGGPPCQTFSAAGRRAAGVMGTKEARGTLFTEYVRVLEQLHPKAFVFENVYGITGAESGKAWREIQAAFEGAGYKIFTRVLDAADFGVPQHRERMFIVGVKKGEFRFPRPTHGPDSPREVPYYTSGLATQIASDLEVPRDLEGRYSELLAQVPPGLNYSFFTERMGHPRPVFAWRSKFSDFLYKADPNWPVRTVKAFCGKYTGPFHWNNRRFTIHELKRLQTFPDQYELVGSRGAVLQQIGNSVPPQLARILALAVSEQVFGRTIPVSLPLLKEGEPLGFRTRKREFGHEYERRARSALSGRGLRQAIKPVASKYTCKVDESFKLERKPTGLPYLVASALQRRILAIHVGKKGSSGFRIEIHPTASNWILPCDSIVIEAERTDRDHFVVAWKAVELWLGDAGLKDDLVQLAGYFAYSPSISCSMSLSKLGVVDRSFWTVVSRLVSGVATREVLTGDEITARLGIENLRSTLSALRECGYEVRSHKTNPQIPKKCFLLPYAFPTYSSRSVQLHKDLF